MFGGIVAIFSGWPDWVLGVAFFTAMVAVCEAGFYWHRRSIAAHGEDHNEGHEAHVLAAALGLLALMIAFTFSMAQGRYDERRALVAAEANALETSYLMSRLLDEPGRSEIAALLRRYVALRLSAFESGGDLAKIEAHDAASEAMHVELWDAMLRAVQPVRTGTIAGLVSEPMARVIALQEERRSARRARVPDEVLGALIVYSLITAYTLGYVMGGIHNRHRIVSTILFALITVSILVTLDLDNPTGGTIRLSPEPLRAAQATLATDFSIAPAAATPVR